MYRAWSMSRQSLRCADNLRADRLALPLELGVPMSPVCAGDAITSARGTRAPTHRHPAGRCRTGSEARGCRRGRSSTTRGPVRCLNLWFEQRRAQVIPCRQTGFWEDCYSQTRRALGSCGAQERDSLMAWSRAVAPGMLKSVIAVGVGSSVDSSRVGRSQTAVAPGICGCRQARWWLSAMGSVWSWGFGCQMRKGDTAAEQGCRAVEGVEGKRSLWVKVCRVRGLLICRRCPQAGLARMNQCAADGCQYWTARPGAVFGIDCEAVRSLHGLHEQWA